MNKQMNPMRPEPPARWTPPATGFMPTQQPVSQQPVQQPMQQPMPKIQAMQQAQATQQPLGQPGNPEQDSAQHDKSIETWLGAKALGVAAAVLVFMGLATLGLSFIPSLDSFTKSALMMGISGVLAVVGSVLVIQRRSVFTEALVGCGMGSLFISLLVSHLQFATLGTVAALGLLLLWMVACTALVAKTRSIVLVVILQVGLFTSVATYALESFPLFGQGPDEDSMLMLVYQAAAVGIAVVANMVLFNQGHRTLSFVLLGIDTILAMSGFPLITLILDQPWAALLGACYVAGLGLAGGYMVKVMNAKPSAIVWFAVACTLLVMTYLYCCVPHVLEGYQWSLGLMACAAVCIAIGFRLSIGGLRLYGLVLTLTSVAWLVLVGSQGADPLTRFVVFVLGGAICFAISALYSCACKRVEMR